jgi:hypothetical protein
MLGGPTNCPLRIECWNRCRLHLHGFKGLQRAPEIQLRSERLLAPERSKCGARGCRE